MDAIYKYPRTHARGAARRRRGRRPAGAAGAARRAARRAVRDGGAVPLPEQDRSGWDRAAIAEGTALLEAALAAGQPGPFQIEAAIAAVHGRAATAADTDWREISALYGMRA